MYYYVQNLYMAWPPVCSVRYEKHKYGYSESNIAFCRHFLEGCKRRITNKGSRAPSATTCRPKCAHTNRHIVPEAPIEFAVEERKLAKIQYIFVSVGDGRVGVGG